MDQTEGAGSSPGDKHCRAADDGIRSMPNGKLRQLVHALQRYASTGTQVADPPELSWMFADPMYSIVQFWNLAI